MDDLERKMKGKISFVLHTVAEEAKKFLTNVAAAISKELLWNSLLASLLLP